MNSWHNTMLRICLTVLAVALFGLTVQSCHPTAAARPSYPINAETQEFALK
jgi:hypothetical protein